MKKNEVFLFPVDQSGIFLLLVGQNK